MIRRLFNVLAVVSMVLCAVASIIFWTRSYRLSESVIVSPSQSIGFCVGTYQGTLWFGKSFGAGALFTAWSQPWIFNQHLQPSFAGFGFRFFGTDIVLGVPFWLVTPMLVSLVPAYVYASTQRQKRMKKPPT